MSNKALLHREIAEKIIGAAFDVHNALGKGLAEKTYENALALRLRQAGVSAQQQVTLPVFFQDEQVGEQIVDLFGTRVTFKRLIYTMHDSGGRLPDR